MTQLDLRIEFEEVSAYLADRVRSFDAGENPGPGDGEAVSRIDLGFGLYESGWACLVFDTRDDAEPDGEWNEFIEETAFERPHWAEACSAVESGPLDVILPDGTSLALPAGSTGELAAALGNMLRQVLLHARDAGLFRNLPRAERCELGVEEQDGSYGWPVYEERGQANLA